jgi:hypothetical protein
LYSGKIVRKLCYALVLKAGLALIQCVFDGLGIGDVVAFIGCVKDLVQFSFGFGLGGPDLM